jgi:hypothetical protein
MHLPQPNWSKPGMGFLKINFDASYHVSSTAGGWGFIICDEAGEGVAEGKGRFSVLQVLFKQR